MKRACAEFAPLNIFYFESSLPSIDLRMRNKHVLCDFVSFCSQCSLFFLGKRKNNFKHLIAIVESMWVGTRLGAKPLASARNTSATRR